MAQNVTQYCHVITNNVWAACALTSKAYKFRQHNYFQSFNKCRLTHFFQTVQKFGGDYAKNISEEDSASLAFLTCFVPRSAQANFPPFQKSRGLDHTEMTTSSCRYEETIIYSIRTCWIRFFLSLLKLINNSPSLNKGNHDRDGIWISDLH